MADIQQVLDTLVHQLQGVPGIAAIVLGGSRALGTATPTSDIDLGLYYESAELPDIAALRRVAAQVDDQRRAAAVTAIGEWGPWINGGAWLTVQAIALDLLYRDLGKVEHVIQESCSGQIEVAYQPGHPHAFVSAIYLAEVTYCRTLWDPAGRIAALKDSTNPYPPALKSTLVGRFLWEAGFSLENARKGIHRRDIAYVVGCCYRTVACLAQVLFALNERYLMNEKGAIAEADGFPVAPRHLAARVTEAFAGLAADEQHLIQAVDGLVALVGEVEALTR
jgi:hypothetical protein